ncbi:MAG TPA: hypothetical protein DGK91_01835 [Clostridium sp.]|jgi:hypothetical protein|nr:hypothetical protein [Clostridia bacterium]HCW03370.1 hypothetical protein [Clostridium sp.]
MKVCPICNAMYNLNYRCSNCSQLLTDSGRLVDYLGPYSADMPIENNSYCLHIYKCSNCGNMENYNYKMINY